MGEHSKTARQPSLHPTDKVNAAKDGIWPALLIVGILTELGIELNPYLSAGIGGGSAFAMGWLTKERRQS